MHAWDRFVRGAERRALALGVSAAVSVTSAVAGAQGSGATPAKGKAPVPARRAPARKAPAVPARKSPVPAKGVAAPATTTPIAPRDPAIAALAALDATLKSRTLAPAVRLFLVPGPVASATTAEATGLPAGHVAARIRLHVASESVTLERLSAAAIAAEWLAAMPVPADVGIDVDPSVRGAGLERGLGYGIGISFRGAPASVAAAMASTMRAIAPDAFSDAALLSLSGRVAARLDSADSPTTLGYAALTRDTRAWASSSPALPSREATRSAVTHVTSVEVRRVLAAWRSAPLDIAIAGPWDAGLDATVAAAVAGRIAASTPATTAAAMAPATLSVPPARRDTVRVASAGYSLVAMALPVPFSEADAPWLPLQIGAWIAGGSPTSSRFRTEVRSAETMGGGATLESFGRGGWLTASAIVAPSATDDAIRRWTATLASLKSRGVTEVEVKAATDEWLANRAAMRSDLRVLPRLVLARHAAGRSFADWDGPIEARARVLGAGEVSSALASHLHPEGATTVVAGPIP